MSEEVNREDVRIRLHAINECGYYYRGRNYPEFGSAGLVFGDLQSWIEGKNLNRTSTYQTDEANGIYSTYCYSIRKNRYKDYLVTTWNGIADSSEIVASVAGNEPVEKAKVNLTEIPDGNIAGFATYFWILPELNRLATVQFPYSKRRNGLPEFRKYISNYMRAFSSYCVIDPQSLCTKNLRTQWKTRM